MISKQETLTAYLVSFHPAGLRQSTASSTQTLTGARSSNLTTKTESHRVSPAALKPGETFAPLPLSAMSEFSCL